MKIQFQITKIASIFCLFLCLFLAPIQLHAEQTETTDLEPGAALAACYSEQNEAQQARFDQLAQDFDMFVTTEEAKELPFKKPYKKLDPTAGETVSASDGNKYWLSADDDSRNAYCQTIEFLKQRISQGNIGQIKDCNTLNVRERDLTDIKCSQLICSTNTNGLNKYYSQSEVKRYDTNNNCQVDTPSEKCQQNLSSQITVCESCRTSINNYLQSPSEATRPKASCDEFTNISNCSTAFSCASGNETPTLNKDYAQTPFGTEYFDVNDPQTGFNSPDEANRNFTTNIQGGPIIGTINTVANFMVRMIAVLSLVVFVIGAFLLIIANGDENRLSQGKDAMKLSIVGILIVMMSYTIVVLVQSILY